MMKFTDSHEWVKLGEKNLARIGVTDYGQTQLGEIVYVELPVIGKVVQAGQEVAVLESTKAAADIYSPISGEIVAVNVQLIENPDLINRSAETEGWICTIRLTDPKEVDALMDNAAYIHLLR